MSPVPIQTTLHNPCVANPVIHFSTSGTGRICKVCVNAEYYYFRCVIALLFATSCSLSSHPSGIIWVWNCLRVSNARYFPSHRSQPCLSRLRVDVERKCSCRKKTTAVTCWHGGGTRVSLNSGFELCETTLYLKVLLIEFKAAWSEFLDSHKSALWSVRH